MDKATAAADSTRKPSLQTVSTALAIGALGGWLATLAGIPLPWMLGSMTAVTLAALGNLPVALPNLLRSTMIVILGVMVGSAFTPEILPQLGNWLFSLSALLLYVIVSGAIGLVYFQRICRYDRLSAYFSAMPGGLSEMVIVGGALGGDARIISLTHASRILIIILALPFLFGLWLPYDSAAQPPAGLPLIEIPVSDLTILAACAVVGFLAARALKLPAAAIVGPMVASAAVHLAGITAAKPPIELVAAAQIVVGAAIGCRFRGLSLRLIATCVLSAAGWTVILVGVSLLFSWVLQNVTGVSFAGLFLAFAPGGVAEMSLIALALALDSAFVATHHVVRIFLIVVLAPALFRLMQRLRGT